ncbi:antitoxin family protein [Archaeoglobus sp.]
MPKIIDAIYENGVFKPLQKVDLKEGERIRLRLEEEGMADIIRRRSRKSQQQKVDKLNSRN